MSTIQSREFTAESAEHYRKQYPALKRQENGQEVVFFDGPAGTQVPQRVADEISRYLLHLNANHGGVFGTSVESDELLHEAHQAFADLTGAESADEIAFGQNMTSLTFAFSRALAKTWNAGDEIVVTALDHDANISPWVLAARDAGVTVRWVRFSEVDFTLNLDELAEVLNAKTRLVAVGSASSATGGINPVKQIAEMAHQHGALVYVDAVHYGPHGLIDVADWNCDFLACSAYKFFGPHLGMLCGKAEWMNSLEAYRVRPAGDELPGKWMTGTQSHESIAGGLACVDYLADIGRELSDEPSLNRRSALQLAFKGITAYEQSLSKQLIEGFNSIPGLKIWGISDLDRLDERFPTFSITHPNVTSTKLATNVG